MKKELKCLNFKSKKRLGRNNTGKITIRHRGGGFKKHVRIIDYKRSLFYLLAVVRHIDYDPFRKSFIALLSYSNGLLSYILAPLNLMPGDFLFFNNIYEEFFIGNSCFIFKIPTGNYIFNVNVFKNNFYCRAAGTFAKILNHSGIGYTTITLPSGELYPIKNIQLVSLGVTSNIDFRFCNLLIAGRNRRLGIRPTVRGVAMNSIDHPMGGGEGKTSGGRSSVSLWGWKTKGFKFKPEKKKNKKIKILLEKIKYSLLNDA